VIVIPNHAYLIIIILSIIFILLLAYIIYLYITTPRRTDTKEHTTIVYSSNEETINQVDVNIQEADLTETAEEDSINVVVDDVENDNDDEKVISVNFSISNGSKTPKIRYNYSMIGRIHQAPKESIERYNQIKNFILAYDGVKPSMRWKYENFIFKGRNAIQLRLQGKTIRIYFDLDYNEFKDSKYNVSFADAKILRSTQVMMRVKSPRALKYALERIQITFEKLGNKQNEIQNVDYTLPYFDLNTLISKDLVKVNTLKK